jgi:hypothetical protein
VAVKMEHTVSLSNEIKYEWLEIDKQPEIWDALVNKNNQSVMNLSGILKFHNYGKSICRGIVIYEHAVIIGVIGGSCLKNRYGYNFTALSFPVLDSHTAQKVFDNLIEWLKMDGCNKYSQLSFDGGLENIFNIPLNAEIIDRLEFVYDLNQDPDTKLKNLRNNHARKLKKVKSKHLELKEVEKKPALVMARLRRTWSKRKGFGASILQFFNSYNYYRRLHRDITRNNAGKLYGIFDNSNNILSLAYMYEDDKSAFYMEGASSQEGYIIGASIKLFWELINLYSSQGKQILNFGGVPAEAADHSHEEHGVYQFKRGFGIEPVARKSMVIEVNL